jgi:hypothetical protein
MPCQFAPGEIASSTNCKGEWVSSEPIWTLWVKGKMSTCWEPEDTTFSTNFTGDWVRSEPMDALGQRKYVPLLRIEARSLGRPARILVKHIKEDILLCKCSGLHKPEETMATRVKIN